MIKNARLFISLFFSLILIFFLVNSSIFSERRNEFIDGDGSGHYAYLPALLLNKSVDFTPVYEAEKLHKSADYVGHNYHQQNGVTINKFTCGTALMQAPFFLLAYLLSLALGLPLDGYGLVFQYAVGVAGVFWLTVGLWFLVQLMRLNRIDRKSAIVYSLVGLAATNLLFYGFVNPSFSHVYSFAAITAFYFFASRTFKKHQTSDIYWSAALFGLIIIIRPANALSILATPFLAGGFVRFWYLTKQLFSFKRMGLALLCFALALSPQLIINFLQTGSLVIDGYKNEGFFFSNPQLFNFLISYQKGWLVYTPFMLLLIPAMFMIFRRSKDQFFALLFFLFTILYIFSSWWNWFYGDSFGMRPMVDFYGLFILIIARNFVRLKGVRLKRLVMTFVGLTVLLNVFQSFQYATGILHPDSMTKQAYWHIFLKSDPAYQGVIAGGDEYFYGDLNETPFLSTQITIDQLPANWSLNEKTVVYSADAGSLVIEQNENFIYSPSYRFAVPTGFTKDSLVYVQFRLKYKELQENAALSALVVMDITNLDGDHVFYKTFRFKRLPDQQINSWREASIGFKIPPIKPEYAVVKFYVWNKNQHHYLLDNLGIELYRYH